MSAPALVPQHRPAILLRALFDYEPSPRPGPPDPLTADRPTLTAVPPLALPPAPAPVWNEPGPARDRLHRLVNTLLETLDGRRTLGQLRNLVDPPVYESLRTRHRTAGIHRHHLRSLRTCRPTPDTLELAATVAISTLTPSSTPTRRPPRIIAFAAQLVRHPTGWRCTLFRPLYPGTVTQAPPTQPQ